MEASDFIVVWSTCPDRPAADAVARGLVERRLAACVTVLPAAASTYRWQGGIEQADEFVLMIKARRSAWAGLEAAVRDLHPYDVPELIGVPVAEGAAPYLAWLEETTE